MKGKLAFLLIALAAIILLSGCTQQEPPANIPPADDGTPNIDQNQDGQDNGDTGPGLSELQTQITACLDKEKDLDKDTCLKSLAVSAKGTDVCTRLKVLSLDECLKAVALASGRATDCKGISVAALKTDCYYNVGINFDSREGCEGISTSTEILKRDDCFKAVSIAKSDVNLCLKISFSVVQGVYARDECITELSGGYANAWVCENILNSESKYDCFEELARENYSAEFCQKISDSNADRADDCLDYVARAISDIDICAMIKDANQSAECNKFVTNAAPGQVSCAQMGTYDERDACYYNLAIENNDGNACMKISADRTLREKCYTEVATATGDSSLCGKIIADERKKTDDCYYGAAIKNNDIELCEKLYMDETYLNCYTNIAIALESYSICDATKREHVTTYSIYLTRDLCYKSYAIEKDDMSICELITNTDVKEACKDKDAALH